MRAFDITTLATTGLEAGRVVQRGTHRELLRAGGLYRWMWERGGLRGRGTGQSCGRAVPVSVSGVSRLSRRSHAWIAAFMPL
jgi:hypothetical protein